MRVLEIGGSGYVGGLINPYLKNYHEIRVLDLKPPQDPEAEFFRGSALSAEDLDAAMRDMEGLIYLAMGAAGTDGRWLMESSYDVNVKGVHLALTSAVKGGVRRAVYASTMSVYNDWSSPHVASEDVLPDSTSVYGFTKWLGEEVCGFFARAYGLPSFALRLNGPISDQDWQSACREFCSGPTSARDVARAFLLALESDHQGFSALHIAGDYENRYINLSRARELIGWEPLERPGRSSGGATAGSPS